MSVEVRPQSATAETNELTDMENGTWGRVARAWKSTNRVLLKEWVFVFPLLLVMLVVIVVWVVAAGKVSSAEYARIYYETSILACMIMILLIAYRLDNRVVRRQQWLLSTVQLHTRYLEQLHALDKSAIADDLAPRNAAAWPWGNHHTELLGHLDAAANKWWALYDPTQPDTAPTNEMVSTWLYDERNVSRDKAKAIASILRADGLRTGPRR